MQGWVEGRLPTATPQPCYESSKERAVPVLCIIIRRGLGLTAPQQLSSGSAACIGSGNTKRRRLHLAVPRPKVLLDLLVLTFCGAE